MKRLFRVYVGDAEALPADPPIDLSAEEAHHVHRVLRLEAGQAVLAFDGRGREWEAELIEASRRGVRLRLGRERTDVVEPPLPLVLFQGQCRPEKMEWVIQKATECGVAAVRPLAAERARGTRLTEQRLQRWRRVALEAAKQSGRRRIPAIDPVPELPDPQPGEVAFLLDTGAVPPLGARLAGPPPGRVALAVGPEGGFAPGEAEAAIGSGWLPAGLGPRTFRTETAGLIAAALVLHRWGDVGPG